MELGDRTGQCKAYSNLGNSYLILGQFDKAAELYQNNLNIVMEVGDRVLVKVRRIAIWAMFTAVLASLISSLVRNICTLS